MADAFNEIVKWVKKFSTAKEGEEDVSHLPLSSLPPFLTIFRKFVIKIPIVRFVTSREGGISPWI
jgi:hypothetical protein